MHVHATRSVAVNFCCLAKLIFVKVAVKFNLRGQEYGKFGYRQRGRESDGGEKEEFKMTVEMMCALILVFIHPAYFLQSGPYCIKPAVSYSESCAKTLIHRSAIVL